MSGTENRGARVVPAKAASEHPSDRTSRRVNEERSAPNERPRRHRGTPHDRRSGRDGLRSGKDGYLSVFGKHDPEHLLEGEKVDTRTPTLEVVAGATPLTAVEPDVVGVVIAAEREREPVDRDPIELTRVAIRLLDLADQGAVHRSATSVARVGRSRGRRPVSTSTGDGGRVRSKGTPVAQSGKWADVTLRVPAGARSRAQGAFVPSRPKSSSRRTTSSSSGVETSISSVRSIA